MPRSVLTSLHVSACFEEGCKDEYEYVYDR